MLPVLGTAYFSTFLFMALLYSQAVTLSFLNSKAENAFHHQLLVLCIPSFQNTANLSSVWLVVFPCPHWLGNIPAAETTVLRTVVYAIAVGIQTQFGFLGCCFSPLPAVRKMPTLKHRLFSRRKTVCLWLLN